MPSMTTTGIIRNMDAVMSQISYQPQPDSSVARCAALLMVDTSRHGEAIFVSEGKYEEVEKVCFFQPMNQSRERTELVMMMLYDSFLRNLNIAYHRNDLCTWRALGPSQICNQGRSQFKLQNWPLVR